LISTPPSIDALWLETLQRVSSRIAHELRGALNGVAVNLEVVRTRSARAETPASAAATFATAASEQFDVVMDMAEALLALSRAASGAADLSATTMQFVALLAPVAKADGRVLRVDGTLESIARSSCDATAARLAIGTALLAASDAAGHVVCRAVGQTLIVESEGGELSARLPDDVVSALKDAGIELQAEPSAISITFPVGQGTDSE